jgi:hypothetical protein
MSSTSAPGLFTSKDRMTIMWHGETKSRTGTGIFFMMYLRLNMKRERSVASLELGVLYIAMYGQTVTS